ncbi:TfoX/Sxy family protein [Oscillospiraceae bacterium CM]|nr:TfoX/Sxy family protein [Oscillospiraceae bacterium CM]
MSTTQDFVEHVSKQVDGAGRIRYRKMFGEYMVYVNDKPVLLVCDNTVYVKKLDILHEEMSGAEVGVPYTGAKEHYILDIDDAERSRRVAVLLESVTAVPKKKVKPEVDRK